MGDPSDPANFHPIALTSVVGKVFHKIISLRLEKYLRRNKVIDASVQRGFITGLPGVFEHIYSLSAILQDATSAKRPLMITFLNLKNAFGSIPHQLIFYMLRTVKVPFKIQLNLFTQSCLLLLPASTGRLHRSFFVEEYFRVIQCLQ